MKEVDNILRILKETKQAMKDENPFEMKMLSNQTVHSATISQDGDNIIVAVLVYALSKVMQREHYRDMEGWNEFHSALIKNWDLAIHALEGDDPKNFRLAIGRIRNSLNKLSGDLRLYIKEVFRKAEINKAFKLYEHGLSSEQTAELLGVSLWDLASYMGQSSLSEAKVNESMPIRERLKIVEEIFG
jgi:hypothetical protein